LFFKAYNTNDLELEFELEIRDAAAWSEARLKRLEEYVTFESFMSAIGRKDRKVYTCSP